MSRTTWDAFVEARNAYLATHERLADRSWTDAIEPTDLTGNDLMDWLGLIQAAEEAARVQREAFERYCERRFHTGTATLRQHE